MRRQLKSAFAHYNGIMCCIAHHMAIDPLVLKKIVPKPKEKETTTTTKPSAAPTPSPPKPEPAPEEEVKMMSKTFQSNGREFTIEFPSSHRLVRKHHLKRWYNDSRKLQSIGKKLQSVQCSTYSIFSQSLWSIAMTSAPALALLAAQSLFPLLLCAFFYDTGLMNGLDINKHAKAFPSDNTQQKHNFSQAARDTMILGNDLRNRKMYMSRDKGNKRGVGHFIEVLSHLDDTGLVPTQLLDIDAAGGASKEAAAAIQASMNKLKVHDDDDAHLLCDQATDSGGGVTIKSLCKELHVLGLTAPEVNYLIANCCIHSLQVQLSNAVKATFGEGALDRPLNSCIRCGVFKS